MIILTRFLVMLDIPSPTEFIVKIFDWFKDVIQSPAVKGLVIICGIIAALLVAWFLSRFTRFIKQLIANLFTPSGFLYFLISIIALIVFLFKLKII